MRVQLAVGDPAEIQCGRTDPTHVAHGGQQFGKQRGLPKPPLRCVAEAGTDQRHGHVVDVVAAQLPASTVAVDAATAVTQEATSGEVDPSLGKRILLPVGYFLTSAAAVLVPGSTEPGFAGVATFNRATGYVSRPLDGTWGAVTGDATINWTPSPATQLFIECAREVARGWTLEASQKLERRPA